MATPYTPTIVSQGFGAESTINLNFSAIATALESVLNKEDDASNVMNVDLDMNGFNILNIGTFDVVVSAENINLVDTGTYFTGSTVETVLQEVGSALEEVKKTGAGTAVSYTLSASNHEEWKQVSGSGSLVVTIPSVSTVDLTRSDGVPYTHYITYNGSGSLTITGAAGTTVVVPEGMSNVLSEAGQHCALVLSTEVSDLWYIIGHTDAE
jgi:hypothetical protein